MQSFRGSAHDGVHAPVRPATALASRACLFDAAPASALEAELIDLSGGVTILRLDDRTQALRRREVRRFGDRRAYEALVLSHVLTQLAWAFSSSCTASSRPGERR